MSRFPNQEDVIISGNDLYKATYWWAMRAQDFFPEEQRQTERVRKEK